MRTRISTRFGAIVLALAAAGAAALPAEETFTFDKNHSQVSFKIRHVVSTVEGGSATTTERSGSTGRTLRIEGRPDDPGGVDRYGRAGSGQAPALGGLFRRREFRRSPSRAPKIEAKGNDSHVVTGDFTMHGVTKPVQVGVKSTGFAKMGKGEKAGFEAGATKLDRKEYGIVWNKALDQGGALLGDEVEIVVQVEANKKEPEPAKSGGQ
jgi:polyisoprenoid-binding protein YceI